MVPYAAHSALQPAGPQAARILDLFYTYLDVSVLVFTLVITALGFALGRKARPGSDEHQLKASDLRSRRTAVLWATGATAVALVGLLFASVRTGHALSLLPSADPVRVQVIGHKWWWEFRYPVGRQATQFSTAYELHVPLNRPVQLELVAPDVIHSFWVPSLTGKRDAIPGKNNVLLLRADRPGVYEGQCAEYCGTEHAHMRFLVVAESPAQFAAWRDRQLTPSEVPTDNERARGLQVFMASRCSACHAISGTDAFGAVGPNLTHMASRKRLAMGTIENDRAHLAAWIEDPQADKPGVQMPGTPLPPADRRALLAYLGGLK